MEFKFERKAHHDVLFKFGHGRYLDAWSFLHIISGFILGLFVLLFDFDRLIGFSVILLLLFFYEMFEVFTNIAEDVENSLLDVFCGGLGAMLVLIFSPFFLPILIQTLIVFLLIAFFVLFIGWRSYLSRRLVKKDSVQNLKNNVSCYGLTARRNIILFFGLAIASIPSPILFAFDFKLAIAWFVFICFFIAFIIHRRVV
ncbi:MAG: hypothetical protein WC694_01930 [Candidatus Paceibacterota bacterium]|jgi:hypothetical protein